MGRVASRGALRGVLHGVLRGALRGCVTPCMACRVSRGSLRGACVVVRSIVRRVAADLLDVQQLGQLCRGVADDDDVGEHACVADDLEDRVPRADVGHRARLVAARRAQVLVHVAAALDGVGHECGAGGERARAREEHDHGEAHREVGKILGGRRALGQHRLVRDARGAGWVAHGGPEQPAQLGHVLDEQVEREQRHDLHEELLHAVIGGGAAAVAADLLEVAVGGREEVEAADALEHGEVEERVEAVGEEHHEELHRVVVLVRHGRAVVLEADEHVHKRLVQRAEHLDHDRVEQRGDHAARDGGRHRLLQRRAQQQHRRLQRDRERDARQVGGPRGRHPQCTLARGEARGERHRQPGGHRLGLERHELEVVLDRRVEAGRALPGAEAAALDEGAVLGQLVWVGEVG